MSTKAAPGLRTDDALWYRVYDGVGGKKETMIKGFGGEISSFLKIDNKNNNITIALKKELYTNESI